MSQKSSNQKKRQSSSMAVRDNHIVKFFNPKPLGRLNNLFRRSPAAAVNHHRISPTLLLTGCIALFIALFSLLFGKELPGGVKGLLYSFLEGEESFRDTGGDELTVTYLDVAGYICPPPPFFPFVSTHILSSRVNPTAGLFYAFSRRFIYLIIAVSGAVPPVTCQFLYLSV